MRLMSIEFLRPFELSVKGVESEIEKLIFVSFFDKFSSFCKTRA